MADLSKHDPHTSCSFKDAVSYNLARKKGLASEGRLAEFEAVSSQEFGELQRLGNCQATMYQIVKNPVGGIVYRSAEETQTNGTESSNVENGTAAESESTGVVEARPVPSSALNGALIENDTDEPETDLDISNFLPDTTDNQSGKWLLATAAFGVGITVGIGVSIGIYIAGKVL